MASTTPSFVMGNFSMTGRTPCFAANRSMAFMLAVGAIADPTTVRPWTTRSRDERLRFSVLIVRGKIFAPSARIGKKLF